MLLLHDRLHLLRLSLLHLLGWYKLLLNLLVLHLLMSLLILHLLMNLLILRLLLGLVLRLNLLRLSLLRMN